MKLINSSLIYLICLFWSTGPVKGQQASAAIVHGGLDSDDLPSAESVLVFGNISQTLSVKAAREDSVKLSSPSDSAVIIWIKMGINENPMQMNSPMEAPEAKEHIVSNMGLYFT